jgi:AcrR family transcriptional regulator
MATARAQHTAARRQEMLAAYYDVLVDEGLQGASLAKVARRLDVPPSLLIHYFGTKEQMTVELVDFLLDKYRRGYGDRLAAIDDSLERLTAILDTLFDPEYHQLLDDSVFYACFYLSLRNPTVRAQFATLHYASLELLETTLRECMAAGHLPPDDVHELAQLIETLEEGYALVIGGVADGDDRQALGAMVKRRARGLLGL